MGTKNEFIQKCVNLIKIYLLNILLIWALCDLLCLFMQKSKTLKSY